MRASQRDFFQPLNRTYNHGTRKKRLNLLHVRGSIMIMVPRKKVCDERKRKKGETRQINVAKGKDRRGRG